MKLILTAVIFSLVAAGQTGSPAAKFVYVFDGAASVRAMHASGAAAEWSRTTEDAARIEGTAEKLPALETGAAHVVLQPGPTYTTLEFDSAAGLAADWSGHDILVLHFDSGSEFLIPITLTVTDAAGNRYVADNVRLVRSRNRLEVPLADFRGGAGKPLDLAHIRTMRMEIRSAEKFPRDLWLHHFFVASSGATLPAPAVLFDFGPRGAPVFPGARVVDEKTLYQAWRGYGWTGSTDRFESWYFNKPKPDPLLSDFVWADLGSGTATLRVDLPDGRYRARFFGGNYTVKALPMREFALAVNGRAVAAKKVDPATYYTSAEFFRGIDDWYEPGEDVWAKRAANVYQHYDFPFTVSGGKAEFTWSGTLAAFALLIAPEGGFDAAAGRVDALRRKLFEANIVQPRPRAGEPAADASEKKRGFLLWSRNWERNAGPFDLPAEGERRIEALRVVAAGNQRAHATLTVTPLARLGSVEAAVSELKNESGAVLPAAAVQVRAVRYLWDGWPARLSMRCLFPTLRAPSPGNANVTWWLTAAPPAGSAPGVYRGSVRVTAQSGGSAVVPVEVRVLPFSLVDDHPVSYSLYRSSNYNLNYSLGHFLPAKMDYFRRILRAEMIDMKAHGMTSYMFSSPFFKGVSGSHVLLDFNIVEEECKAAKECGLAGRPGMVSLIIDVSRNLMKETRLGDWQEPDEVRVPLAEADQVEEFSDLFNRRYVDAARQIRDFFARQGIAVLMNVADEPRERNVDQWNRNLADSIRYADLLRAALPGVKTQIDPMRDSENGTNYLSLLEHYDVVATHPWDQSSGFYRGTRGGKPELQYYNSIMNDRYDFGFGVAASHATGFAQWHYQWILLPFQPFHGTSPWGLTLPGPDGPLDMPEYERMAAGIDDYRYVATLRARVARAKQAGKGAAAVRAAEADLAELLANTQPYPERKQYQGRGRQARSSIAGRSLDEWRMRLAADIQAIDKAKP